MANLKLSPKVKDVLERSTITATSVKLPEELDPKLYRQVNQALDLAGGKWSRSAKAHLFASDPREKLGLALAGAVLVDEKQLYGVFYTPPDLANHMAVLADVTGARVLEPSAGDGALAEACRELKASDIMCVDIRPEAVKVLQSKKFLIYHQGDFLEVRPPTTLASKFDCVVMNPPFSRGVDLKHIGHALKFLKPGGTLVSVLLDNKKDGQLQTLCVGCDWDVDDLGPGVFKEAGTPVSTSLLTVHLRG